MRLFVGLLDDAAVFPPGDLPLDEAVPAHLAHQQASYGDLVGPLVVGAADLGALADVVDVLRPGAVDVAVTAPAPLLARALQRAARIPAIRVVAVEASLPDGMSPDEALRVVGGAAGEVPDVFVEVPRDERRERLLAALAWAGHAAKFRTGGVRAELHPDDAELAVSVVAAVRAGVPFKATAGLHHAVRNTDPATGFEQHGFLNLLVATGAAIAGADGPDVAAVLADRDAAGLVARARELPPRVRDAFRSFGTCSIAEPVEELAGLGLLADPAGVPA